MTNDARFVGSVEFMEFVESMSIGFVGLTQFIEIIELKR